MKGITTITVRPATRDRLAALGAKGDSFEAILNRLLDGVAQAVPAGNSVPSRRR